MIRALLIDLNGILITSEKLSDRFAKKFQVSRKEFLPVLKQSLAQARRPKAKPMYSYWKDSLKSWNVPLSRKKFYDFWFHGEKLNSKALQTVKKLKKDFPDLKIIIVSNNFRERSRYYKITFPALFQLVDGVSYSWKTGFVKPDRRVYQTVLKKYGVKAKECLYFDDVPENVTVTKKLGMHSFVYTTVVGLERTVRKELKKS